MSQTQQSDSRSHSELQTHVTTLKRSKETADKDGAVDGKSSADSEQPQSQTTS